MNELRLRTALEDLASEAPVRVDAPSSMLKRARRRRTRSVVAGLTCVAVVASGAVVAAGSLGRESKRVVKPVASACPTGWSSAPAPPHPIGSLGVSRTGELWATGGAQPFALRRWDGAHWTAVPQPPRYETGDYTGLGYVHPIDADAIWAGAIYYVPGRSSVYHVARWNGAQWTDGVTLEADTGYAIDSSGPADVWVLGTRDDYANDTTAFHWDGSAWTSVPLPRMQYWTANFDTDKIIAVAPHDTWIFGQREVGPPGADGHGTGQPFILHRTTGEWNDVGIPREWADPLPYTLQIAGGSSSDNMWFVRQPLDGTTHRITLARWNGTIVESMPVTGLPVTFFADAIEIDARGTPWLLGRQPDTPFPGVYNNRGKSAPAVYRWTGSEWTGGRLHEELDFYTEVIGASLPDGGIAIAASTDEQLRWLGGRPFPGPPPTEPSPHTRTELFVC